MLLACSCSCVAAGLRQQRDEIGTPPPRSDLKGCEPLEDFIQLYHAAAISFRLEHRFQSRFAISSHRQLQGVVEEREDLSMCWVIGRLHGQRTLLPHSLGGRFRLLSVSNGDLTVLFRMRVDHGFAVRIHISRPG